MQVPDGTFLPLLDDDANVLRRIAAAGKRELPIFGAGEVVTVRGANFRVLALDGHLLVLSGISKAEAEAWYAAQATIGQPV